jgi:hypothetical protein
MSPPEPLEPLTASRYAMLGAIPNTAAAEQLPHRMGDVELWWLNRPARPRMSIRSAVIGVCILIPISAAAAGRVLAVTDDAESLWPWSDPNASAEQIVLRYLFVLIVALFYALARSLPAWIRSTRQANSDLVEAEGFCDQGRWFEAAIRLHRHCVLRREVWRRLPVKVRALDERIRPYLDHRRRVYIYFKGRPPELPEFPEAGFSPMVVPTAIVGWWSVPMIILLAATAYAELSGTLKSTAWTSIRAANFFVLAGLILIYVYLYAAAALGRRDYFRFAPGIAEFMSFGIIGRRAKVRSIRLRECDVILDLVGPKLTLATVPESPRQKQQQYILNKKPEVIEASLRAVFSTASIREMPNTQLVD